MRDGSCVAFQAIEGIVRRSGVTSAAPVIKATLQDDASNLVLPNVPPRSDDVVVRTATLVGPVNGVCAIRRSGAPPFRWTRG